MAKKGLRIVNRDWAAGRSWNACCGLATAFYGRLPAGVPKSSLIGSAQAAEAGFTSCRFRQPRRLRQESQSNALGTLQEAIAKV